MRQHAYALWAWLLGRNVSSIQLTKLPTGAMLQDFSGLVWLHTNDNRWVAYNCKCGDYHEQKPWFLRGKVIRPWGKDI